MSSSTAQTLELGVFLGGESGEFINLGTLYLTHDQNLSKNILVHDVDMYMKE